MHKIIEDIVGEVTRYSTVWGQMWYLIVFGYRFIVVSLFGEYVYLDEQEFFRCSVDLAGCTEMCYNEYAKISHVRFWGFQLLAVTAPTFLFHFYALYVHRQIEKIESTHIQHTEQPLNAIRLDKLARRKKKIGKYRKVKRLHGGNLIELPSTKKVYCVYLFTVILRTALEALFLYITFVLYNVKNEMTPSESANFLWMNVPGRFECHPDNNEELGYACNQHIGSFVPCWVSRPYEKTVFLRYMNICSFICLIISTAEIVAVAKKRLWNSPKKRKQQQVKPASPARNVQLKLSPPLEPRLAPPSYCDEKSVHYKVIDLSDLESYSIASSIDNIR